MPSRKTKKKKPLSISRSRPPTSKPSASLSSKATRNLIRTHHQLRKSHSRALAQGDQPLAEDLAQKIDSQGGLQSYQLASKTGQSIQRGGDSSTMLVEWLSPALNIMREHGEKLRVLEVGALSTRNAISRAAECEVTRIDLHSQEDGILQQDFMERAVPTDEGRRFHIVSLSLVLNFVPDAAGRGEMLRWTTEFLCQNIFEKLISTRLVPCLFLVLPAACVTNSRYLTEKRLEEITETLGYHITARKISPKLAYFLLQFDPKRTSKVQFKKLELRPGGQRNNFAIMLH